MTDNEEEFVAAYRGLKNNYPEALPDPFLSPGQKAKALSARGFQLPTHQIPLAPIVRLAPAAQDHFHRFTAKLMRALFYRTVREPLPATFRVITHWTTADQPDVRDLLGGLVNMMPALEVGRRVNTDLGNQFAYRYALSAERDVMALTASFSDKLFVTSIAGRADIGLEFDQFAALAAWREDI